MPESFKTLVWDVVVKAVLTKLFEAVPWLGWGPIGTLVSFLIGTVGESLYSGLSLAVDMRKIQLKNDEHRRAFDLASVKLAILAREKGLDSAEFKQARDEQKKALSTFIKWEVS